MKKSLLFSAVLAGLMLGSCSSSDDIAGTSEKFSADGKGYVNVTLNLPTQPQSTSRAINDEFDHGVDGLRFIRFQKDLRATHAGSVF